MRKSVNITGRCVGLAAMASLALWQPMIGPAVAQEAAAVEAPAAENAPPPAPGEAPAPATAVEAPPAAPAPPANDAPPAAAPVEPAAAPETPEAPAAPQPPAPPVPPTTRSIFDTSFPETAATSPGTAPAPIQGKLLLNFRDASLDAVLDYLSESAGLVVIRVAKIEGRITLISKQPLTVDEAVSALNSVLKEKGYAGIRSGRTLRIVTLEAARKANVPVRSGSDPRVIATDDEVITQVIPIKYADAMQLKRDLSTLIPPYADLAANASTNTLILTDTAVNVRRIVEIVHALDTAVSSVSQVRVFQLKYANATNAARLVNDLFKQDQAGAANRTNQPGGFFSRMFAGRMGGGGAPGAAASGAEGSRPALKIQASADERTNTVVVSSPPEVMQVIEEVLKELDSNPAQDQAVFVYYLKNAQAANVEAVINSLYGTGGSSRTATSTQNRLPTTGATGRTSSSGSTMGLGTARRQTTTSGQRATTSGQRTTAANRTGAAAGAAGAAGLSGQVYIVSDPDTNSVLVMTASSNIEQIKTILRDLDRAVPQVVIKVLVAEVTHTNTRELGVEFSAASGSSEIGTRLGVAAAAASAATGGLVYGLSIGNDFEMTIRALEQEGRLEVLSRPSILASDNQLASIIVGQEVPIISNSRITDTGQTINTLQYREVGIILDVIPHINPDGQVVLDVQPEISALTGDTVPISDTASQPIIAKRSAQTRVAIKDGQTIVIGGLMEDQYNTNVRKVPLLGDIPVLGALFRNERKEKSKTELLIFLTPHVTSNPEQLEQMSEDEKKGHVIIDRAIEPGALQRHLEGMKRGAAPKPEPTTPATPPTPADLDAALEPEP